MKLYNSRSLRKETFSPLKKDEVTLYVCGITPYDTTHLGHASTYIFFDTLVRYLAFHGLKVNYTQNVTDIDNDILKRARETDKNWQELGTYWTNHFLSDLRHLNVLMPTHYVKATDSIPTIQKITKKLLADGIAYEASGNVYFSVKKFKPYGKLSHFTKRQMVYLAAERGGYPDDPHKKEPLDFLLWQKSTPGEPSWDSPWSNGRPGWHIECSAMILDYLGEQIDIHGGGRDLIFPHHESEIAQSESFTGKMPFVGTWMHTGMLMYQGEKMGKSLGNLVMISDLLKKYSANEIRFTLLSRHYRKPWEFEMQDLRTARRVLKIIENALGDTKIVTQPNTKNPYFKKVLLYLDDDMNTPSVLNYLVTLARKTKKEKVDVKRSQMKNTLGFSLELLGFQSK